MTAPRILMVDELVRRGLARPVTFMATGRDGIPHETTRTEISEKGQRELRDNQLARGRYFRDHPEESAAIFSASIRHARGEAG